MGEARIAFLYKAASLLPTADISETEEKLKSYYRMRCKELTKGHGLPKKHFSEQVICTHCCLEWRKGTEVKVKSIKLTRRQRKRIKSKNKMSKNTNNVHLLDSNEIEKTCTFCRNSIKTVVQKANRPTKIKVQQPIKQVKSKNKKRNEKVHVQNTTCDVYSNAAQVFSLNNKKNILKSTIIKEPKIVKNNKKKKDKFAGLCKKAVLMSAQLKQQKEKQNKLNLFLKPSS